MKPVRIAVCMKEPAFGRAVARGLAESGSGFLIEVVEPKLPEEPGTDQPEEWPVRPEAWEVLVTDGVLEDLPGNDLGNDRGNDLEAGKKEPDPCLVLADPETCRISQLCREVQEAADRVREKRGIGSGEGLRHRQRISETECRNEGSQPTEIIGFQGFCGGCGVTALAVTAGRMLAGAYGEKVLYLPLTETDGAGVYQEAEPLRREDTSGVCPPKAFLPKAYPQIGKELLYRLSHRLPCSLDRFMRQDGYGLEMPEGMDWLSAEERLELLKLLTEKGVYDWILVDLGNRDCFRSVREQAAGICSVLMEVGNRMDSRCTLDSTILTDSPVAPDSPVVTDSPVAPERLNTPVTFPERRIMVWNHGAENRMAAKWVNASGVAANRVDANGMADGEQECLEIAHDAESFQPDRETGRIAIAMTKNFAIGVKNLTEILMNFYENNPRNMSKENEW